MGGANGGVGGGWARLCGSVRGDYLFCGTKSLETEKRIESRSRQLYNSIITHVEKISQIFNKQ